MVKLKNIRFSNMYELYLPRYRPYSSSEDRRFKANEGK